jgi:hypothetical protein
VEFGDGSHHVFDELTGDRVVEIFHHRRETNPAPP